MHTSNRSAFTNMMQILLEAAPVITEEVVPEVIPESAPVVEAIEEIITVPQAAPELPKTGGLPLLMLIGLGSSAIVGGLKLKK